MLNRYTTRANVHFTKRTASESLYTLCSSQTGCSRFRLLCLVSSPLLCMHRVRRTCHALVSVFS